MYLSARLQMDPNSCMTNGLDEFDEITTTEERTPGIVYIYLKYCIEHYSPKMEGSTPDRVTFLLNLYCSNTILEDLTE